ncbi:cilia- and flagella-associated protein 54 [Rhinatrema bivittatum]|uniref:cilia- and flagella-associated protein 54 n=1 Tax=Rhinatrema bivittatum TaxID=194408 RepID=UPI00112B44F6|nr:cilia- and flagella-associated protein 54 [Rhinatrema bivittatum]
MAGMEPLTAHFYGPIDAKNPVIATFENEIKQFLESMTKIQNFAPGDRYQNSRRQGANNLFNIWIKYEPRLPAGYYHEKLLKVGDSLCEMKEYKLALLQCYERYLQQFKSVNLDEITDVKEYQSIFFPKGVKDENTGLTFHALQGRCFCIYQIVKTSDVNLKGEDSVKKCLSILSLLRLNMQLVLPQEHLCWLIYNGTIHIYNICRHLMRLGHSLKALDFLLWASICMESSVPLLSVHYLTWRVTLYTAVCQCYYDCKAGVQAEIFARRGLSKIAELNELELMSKSNYPAAAEAFTEATTKMAVMIFKRAVFESRRRTKTGMRSKQRFSVKETEKLSWPRNFTERLLCDMFNTSTHKFLAILEAVSDSNRRILKTGPPVPDEPEIHEVIAELFFAGTDIVLEKDISMDAAVKFVKLVFNYEQWEIFDTIIPPIFFYVQSQENSRKQQMELKLLIVMEPLVSGKKPKHGLSRQDYNAKNEEFFASIGGRTVSFQGESVNTGTISDDLFMLAETLYFCTCNTEETVQPDKDMVIDALLFLWQKVKSGFRRIQTGATDCSRFFQKFEISSKHIYLLWLINEAMHSCDIAETDATMMAEVALRLAVIFENMADSAKKSERKSVKETKKTDTDTMPDREKAASPIFLKKIPSEQLQFAYEILEKAITEMAKVCTVTKLLDEIPITDNYATKLVSAGLNLKSDTSELGASFKSARLYNFVMDLHLELILAQHRVSVKILHLPQDDVRIGKPKKQPSYQSLKNSSFLKELEQKNKTNKNNLSKAIFLMQKAALVFNRGLVSSSPHQLLEEAFMLIQKAETEETALNSSSVKQEDTVIRGKNNVPPSPILISRTYSSMTFKAAAFASDVKVSWYCLLGRKASGDNMNIRINDYHIPDTGEKIPAVGDNILEANGLEANEKYIFAVAAYSSDGKLIGDAIGAPTKPILAYPPLSALVTWTYMVQISYQVGHYRLAKKAFSVLWKHFVFEPSSPSSDVSVVSASNRVNVSQKRLCVDALLQASPILLQLFLVSIFSACDINVKEGALFCDSVSANGIPYKLQIQRIAECERMLVALELSNYLNDTNYALQAVVQCYGLLAPIIYHRIPSVPVVQILLKCLAVLQDVPNSTWQKKTSGCPESVVHMIACTVCYLAKVLRSWKEYDLTVIVIEIGKRLLLLDIVSLITGSSNISSQELFHSVQEKREGGQSGFEKKSYKKKLASLVVEKVSEQFAALEANILKRTTPLPGHELTGQENPVLLLPIVTCWPVKSALKEVMKFKGKNRFLEFFVQVLHRTVHEEVFEEALEWTSNIQDFLKKRNEFMISGKKGTGKETSYITVTGEAYRRYTAALVEYQQTRAQGVLKSEKQVVKPGKKKENNIKQERKQSELLRNSQAGRERRAFTTLVVLLTPIVAGYMKRKSIRRTSIDEMPWRSLMNVLLAITHFSLFKQQLAQQFKNEGLQKMRRFGVLDPEMFSLYHSGTVIMQKEAKTTDETGVWQSHAASPLKMEPKTRIKSVTDSDVSGRSTKISKTDTPRTQMTNETDPSYTLSVKEDKKNPSVFSDSFNKAFLHLRRAVVLAHRGSHWTLLQNVCRELWNITLETQLISRHGAFHLTMDLLNRTIWLPFFLASDMIMDMIVTLQNNNSIQIIDSEGDFSIPSCTGGIAYEDGGSSLSFDYPLDDVNVVDLRWICNLVLKTMEVLYHLRKWEALVHIAIQFNMITHERYTEQVTPLLVHAQRQLIDQINYFSGPKHPQPHFMKYMMDHSEKIYCRNFIGKQFRVATAFERPIESDDNIDYEVPKIYADVSRAKALISVPLDVMDTLKYFRETLEKSKYHSRALRHSRKLFALFLAHIQGLETRKIPIPGKVGFNEGVEQTYEPVPPNLLKEDFTSLNMIQSNAIPSSQLSVVISSYEKTVAVLHASRKRELKAQALHELGNLHIYNRHQRAAFKCWCQALDEAMNMANSLNTWQELDSDSEFSNLKTPDHSKRFLFQAGIWGCLQAAVLTAKIAKYILTSNVRLRTKCCILSSFLFKALLRSSLSHPRDDCDYALYEIDEECEVRELIPGIDLFSDRYRADVSTVVASLNFIILELHGAGHNLLILPLFTLYQYFVSKVCHEPIKSIEGRILKAKALTDLRYFTEACYELMQINQGRRIPKRLGGGFRHTANDMILPKLDLSKPLLVKENLLLIQDILNEKPSVGFMSVCENQMLNKLILAKMHFLISLCATTSVIPDRVKKASYTMTQEVMSKYLRGHKPQSADMASIIQLVSKQDLTMASLKGILLTEAEGKLTTVLENLQKNSNNVISQFPATELEIAVEAKLLLVTIAQQRHQTALSVAMAISTIYLLQDANISVAMAISTIYLLQDANIFKMKHRNKTQIIPSLRLPLRTKKHKYAYDTDIDIDNMEARDRMNIHLWFRCRLMLITVLVAQIRGVGVMKEWNLLDCSSLITEALMEADAFGDIETKAKMMLQSVLLNLQEGRPKKDIKQLLKDLIHLLEGKQLISPETSLTLIQGMILLADIMVTELEDGKDQTHSEKEPLNLLILANKLINKQLLLLGQDIQQHLVDTAFTTPLMPLRNIYLSHIAILAKVKLRIGNTLAQQVACTFKAHDSPQWLPVLGHFNNALELCRISSLNELDVEAEVLFQMGKVERQIIVADHLQTLQAAENILNAIKISWKNDQNFGLIRKSYLEIALLYFHLACLDTKKKTKVDLPKSPITDAEKTKNEKEATLSQSEQYRLRSWIAIRAATQVSEAMTTYQQLLGQHNLTLHILQPSSQHYIPAFASMDLLASYKDFLTDDYQLIDKNIVPEKTNIENDEKLAEEEVKPEEEEIEAKDDDSKKILSWFPLICYHNHLINLVGLTSRIVSPKSANEICWKGDTLYTSVVNIGIVQRLAEMHHFLKKHLFTYTSCCINESPKELQPNYVKSVISQHSKMSLEKSESEEFVITAKISESDTLADIQNVNMATIASDKELCVQWYLPSLERPPKEEELMIKLLYAYNTNSVKVTDLNTCNTTDVFCGHLWIPLARVVSLHENLIALKQQAEFSSHQLERSASSSTKKKQASNVKAKSDSEKLQLDSKAEEMFKECCSEAKDLLSTIPDRQPLTKIPVEISMQSLTTLQDIFDSSGGCVITGGSVFDWITSLLS